MKTIRSYGALELVKLPRLDANAAQSLGRAVIAGAEGASLSEGAREALLDVRASLTAVGEVVRGRLSRAEDDSPRVKLADAAVDAAWSATYDWLTGWSRLPRAAARATAATLRSRLFPDKRSFLRLKVVKEWAESEARLTLIEEQGLEARFIELGGAAFLEDLRATHAAYGEALGVTKVIEPEEAARLDDALSALADALRGYVLQVSAMARRADPASQALVDRLLAPITGWASAPAKGAPAPDDEEVAPSALPDEA